VIVLIVAGVLGLLCLGICGLGIFGFTWGVRQVEKVANEGMPMIQEAIQEGFLVVQAQASLMNNAEVKEKLGEPLNFGTPDNQPAQPGDHKTFKFTISGPKGQGTVHAEAQRQGNEWNFTSLQVRLSDGSTIDVDASQPFTLPADSATPSLPTETTDPPGESDSSPVEPTPAANY
jgi:hypothetical protein